MMYGSFTSTLLRQMPSTIWRSVRQTPAPPIRTTTSVGRVIFGSGTSSNFTNSLAVSFSSNAWSTAAFIFPSLTLLVCSPADWAIFRPQLTQAPCQFEILRKCLGLVEPKVPAPLRSRSIPVRKSVPSRNNSQPGATAWHFSRFGYHDGIMKPAARRASGRGNRRFRRLGRMTMLAVRRSVDHARAALEREGMPPADFLAPDIYDSWMRCIAYGLDSRHPPEPEIVPMAELRQEHQRHSFVRGLALAEMHSLHQQIAGTNFMIAFASPEGLLLDIVSDNSFKTMSDAASIRPGAVWKESVCGTNGLGSVAHLKRALTVHGGEHFFPRYNNLTCTAVPVIAPDGQLCGVLDASSDCLSRQAHTRALVGMAATQVENGLFREQHRGSNIITLHNRGEYLHTISAGLLAVDSDGCILAANRAAQTLLHGLPISPGKRFGDVFRTRFSSFLEEGRRHERQKLQDEVGSHFIASIENPRQFPFAQTLSKPKPAPPPSVVPPAFVSADPKIAEIVRRVGAAAARKMPILIRGETGTGKEQLARYAHAASRRSGAFVPVNCSALPESLIEAELFGYTEGAFTGARKGGSVGLFREADGGTLFLDEIGDMPVAL